MFKSIFVVLLFLLPFYLAKAGEISVLTYNMAQLRKAKVDLVACTTTRLRPQIEAIFGDEGALKHAEYFVVLLQEAWTKRAFFALKRVALERNLQMLPETSAEASVTGTVLLSNLSMIDHGFRKFSRNKYLPKGILHATLELPWGGTMQVANVHTGYSDSRGFTSEQQAHFQDIHRFAVERANIHDHFVVGGDFNAGPDMAYKKQRYLPAPLIWDQTLLPIMSSAGLHHVSAGSSPTWDTHNALVFNAAFAIKALNGFTYHTWGWEELTATLDHIFADTRLVPISSKTVLTEKARLRCPGRNDSSGLAHLSDHYGVLTVLEAN